jgi:hypothetical protein
VTRREDAAHRRRRASDVRAAHAHRLNRVVRAGRMEGTRAVVEGEQSGVHHRFGGIAIYWQAADFAVTVDAWRHCLWSHPAKLTVKPQRRR